LNFSDLAVTIDAVNRESLYLSLAVGVFSFFFLLSSFGQGTAFMYQGQLNNGGTPANGNYDFDFAAYDAVTNGDQISISVTNNNVAVNNGLFTTTIDFGAGVFGGTNIWLGIGVSTDGTHFTPLWPRQPVLPVPYAIFANSASNLVGILQATQLVGTLPAGVFAGSYTNSVAFTNSGNLFAGSFSGNGGSVTNVNVASLTGILADNQLPTNTAFLNSNQTFTANNTFNGSNTFTNLYGNSFSGSFFGNGLVGWIVVTGTTVQASIDHGYLLTNSQIVTVTLPTLANVGDIVRIACASPSGWQLVQNTGQSVVGNFYSDGNNTWYQSSASALNWNSIDCSSDGTRMAATIWSGSSDGVYLSVNSGATWNSSSATGKQYNTIAISADGTKLITTVTNGSIYISTNAGTSWTAVTASLSWSSVACSADGTKMFAAVNGGFIFNGGPTSAWPTNNASFTNWSSIACSADGVDLVAGDQGGQIYVSKNSGTTWAGAGPSANWQSVASSADGTKLVAAADPGGVYTSTNSGTSWVEQTGVPTKTNWTSVACSSDGSKIVAVVNGSGIYTSSNWGNNWQANSVPTNYWSCVTSSASGATLAAGINNTISGGIYYSGASSQTISTTAGTGGYISGPQGSAVELQYIGNNQFMPVSYSGTIWAH
jgi:hypothetical protein